MLNKIVPEGRLAECNLRSAMFFPGQKKSGFSGVKIPLLFLGLFLTLSAISQAGPARGGFSGRSFHTGFTARGGGFRGRFIARSNRPAFRMGNEIHRDFTDRRFFRRNRPIFFQQFGWPGYWYPYTDPLAYSYLEPDSSSDYQYWDNSSAQVQPESTNQAVPENPMVVVINTGNSRPTDFGALTGPRGDAGPRADGGYLTNGYISTSAGGQQRTVVQDPNDHTVADPIRPGDPVDPPATPVPQQNIPASVRTGAGPFGKFIIVSCLQDGGKSVITIKNVETNAVQRVTSQPNIDHFRIVEIHPNADLRQFEAIISNGSDQGPVRFQF
jgi:hypothetical protein